MCKTDVDKPSVKGRYFQSRMAMNGTLFLLLLLLGFFAFAARANNDSDAGTPAPADSMGSGVWTRSPFDSVSRENYLSYHSFSLDNFLETETSFLLSRRGPIGADSRLSRYGMGAGRCSIYLDGIPFNDPQGDFAPVALVPTTSIGALVYGRKYEERSASMEGVIDIPFPEAPRNKPSTEINLSKGNNEIKQRRVRFSSVQSRAGVDFAYDELLNGGYGFNSENLQPVAGMGSFTSRMYTMRIRGKLSADKKYVFSFRRFKSSFQGDLSDPKGAHMKNGHLASIAAEVNGVELSAYEREYENTAEDSLSDNRTIGAAAAWNFSSAQGLGMRMTAGVENTLAHEEVAGSYADPRLNTVFLGTAFQHSAGNLSTSADLHASRQFSYSTGWGGRLNLSRSIGRDKTITAFGARLYRLPSLAELFIPLHTNLHADSVFSAGNGELKGENLIEVGAMFRGLFRSFMCEVSLSTLRVGDVITAMRSESNGLTLIELVNGPSESMGILSGRAVFKEDYYGVHMLLSGGGVLTNGDKGPFLSSAPHSRLFARLSLGTDLFKRSSSLALALEYAHSSAKTFVESGRVPSFDTANIKLDISLLDAHFYLHFLNLFNKGYYTEWPYLMTPRTFVYGIQWNIFE